MSLQPSRDAVGASLQLASRPPFLVLLRGESFRAGGQQSNAIACTREAQEAQSLAASSARALLAELATQLT